MSQVSPPDRLLAEEPFVRTLAQALLAEEADEVVQPTWPVVRYRRVLRR